MSDTPEATTGGKTGASSEEIVSPDRSVAAGTDAAARTDRIIVPAGAAVAESLPVVPVKNTVLFPYVFFPMSVGRPGSLAAVQAALESEEKTLLVLTQRDAQVDQPGPDDLYAVATRAVIKRMARSENVVQLLVQGLDRVRVEEFTQTEPHLKARGLVEGFPEGDPTETEALQRNVLQLGQRMVELAQPDLELDLSQLAAGAEDPMQWLFQLASMLALDTEQAQRLLEAKNRIDVLRLLNEYMQHELQVLELKHQISSKARTEIGKEQREYLLRQQLKAIQEELGEIAPQEAEVEQLREQLREIELPEEVRKEADRNLRRLEQLPPHAPDYQLTRTWLELVAELPWQKASEDSIDLTEARRVLDEDHFDLEEVKDRILEHLAVMKLNPKAHSPILCFIGPPGVGKTSLGQSIARSLGRKFERLSLGGMHDEAELRGHRRTYIGAMPGRIIESVRRAGVNNPLLMLDEVDKLGRDFRGDPASALLEILDPAQNHTFRDNYLDLPFDLSQVFFITTANTLETIPRPLLDRMETLRLAGYTEEEKVEIARRYLIPRQLEQAGISAGQIEIPDETLKQIIVRHTREAGVRQLERAVGRLARKVAIEVAGGRTEPMTIRREDLREMLGAEKHRPEQMQEKLPPGVAVGLAWTEAGGEVLHVEATLLPEGKDLRLTGQLGDVMRESAQAAQSYIVSHAERLGIDREKFKNTGVHIHVPAGAVPKDGPSAGVAMVTALASLYSGVPARHDTAMTGEITLSGRVLPVGGIKEKVLAGRSAGIRRVILPKENETDLRDIPEPARGELEFILAERIEDVLVAAIPQVGEKLK